jgi:hypothetical protein
LADIGTHKIVSSVSEGLKKRGRQTKSLYRMETVQYTTYMLHITATCFGYVDVAIIRLYTEL